MTCSEQSAASGEPLAGTASRTERVLVVEARGAWGRDALGDSSLPPPVRERLEAWVAEGPFRRVLFARRPERRDEPELCAYAAHVTPGGGTLRRLAVRFHGDLLDADLYDGEPVSGPLLLVCTHGRRDPCCARLGIPLYDALAPHVPDGVLWQSSHQGGHRFAGNVLALPSGVQLGRVPPGDAAQVAALLLGGRIPLDLYRGSTLYAPSVQTAEAAVRRARRLDRLADVRLVHEESGAVRFAVPGGHVDATLEEREGPPVPPSCGAAVEPTRTWHVRVESSA